MARQVWDSVVETSTTTGTGDFTLAGAVLGYQAFDDVCAVGDLVFYLIEGIDGDGLRTGEWESGNGTYSASNTLTRTIFRDGSNYPSATNFSAGTKRVTLSATSLHLMHRGCLAYVGTDLTTQNFTTAAAIPFNSDQNDKEALHDNVTDNSRTISPLGVNLVEIKAHVRVESHTANKYTSLFIYKDGAVNYVGQGGNIVYSNLTSVEVSAFAAQVEVDPTSSSYFEAYLECETDTSVTVKANRTWLALRVLE